MRIVHVYDGHEQIYSGQGSLPRIIWNVAKRSADRGHEVTIVERKWNGLSDRDSHEGVTFRRLPLRTGSPVPWEEVPYEMVQHPSGIGRLVVDRTNFGIRTLKELRGIDYDVIHVYLPFAANVMATISPNVRSRMVYTAQLGELRLAALTDNESENSVSPPWVVRRFSPDIYLARRTGATTVLNPHIKRVFEQRGVAPNRLHHIPNGVDIQNFSAVDPDDCERVREKYRLGDDPVVFFAGTIMPRKGVADLIQAAGEVIQAGHDNVRFLIAGETDLDKSYMESIRELVTELNIEENVIFTGYLGDGDLLPAYQLASVFVLPSYEEGFGMVVSEALAAGTPVVASRINGVIQQIDENETGFLVEPGDSGAFAAAIQTLLREPGKRKEMGARGQERAQRFSWESVTDQYIDLYDEVTNRLES